MKFLALKGIGNYTAAAITGFALQFALPRPGWQRKGWWPASRACNEPADLPATKNHDELV